MNAIDGTGLIVDAPDWSLLLDDPLEIAAAEAHWQRITAEMRGRDILASANVHAIQRLVIAYLIYDRAARAVTEQGAVLKPKRGNPKSIARLNPHFTAMRESGSDAERIEAELGLSPRRRTGAAKVVRNGRKATAASSYLKSVK